MNEWTNERVNDGRVRGGYGLRVTGYGYTVISEGLMEKDSAAVRHLKL